MTKHTKTRVPPSATRVTNAVTGEVVYDQRVVKLHEILNENGYLHIKYVEGWGWCAIQYFIFTVGVCFGLDETGRAGRFCFADLQSAMSFYQDWDGTTQPIIGQNGCLAIK